MKKSKYITMSLFVWAHIAASAQLPPNNSGNLISGGGTLLPIDLTPYEPGDNYIVTRTYLDSEGENSVDRVDYYNGLGYLEQTVLREATPDRRDLAIVQEYDPFNRPNRAWLPALTGAGEGAYTDRGQVKINAMSQYSDQTPFATTVYEETTGRVEEQHGPGDAWAATSTRFGFLTNDGTDSLFCRRFAESWVQQTASKLTYTLEDITDVAPYAPGDLTVFQTTSEDGAVSYRFEDALGRTILERQVNGADAQARFLDTYYVYDAYGNLCFVLPPLMMEAMAAGSANLESLLEKYAFRYKYDCRHRAIAKQTPGAGWTYYIYDSADRVGLYQTPNLRATDQWYSQEYDAFGNLVRKSLITLPVTLNIEDIYSGIFTVNGFSNVYCQRLRDAAIGEEYVEAYLYGENVYHPAYAVDPDIVVGSEINSRPTGLKTYEELPVYGDGYNYDVVRHYYYDYEGRVRRIVEQNHLGGITVKSFKYNFSGQPEVVRTRIQTIFGIPSTTKTSLYNYDHAGRLSSETTQVQEGADVLALTTHTVTYAYDTQGRLVRKNSEEIDEHYAYNIRGWETMRANQYFVMRLRYENPELSVTTPRYGGDISEMMWGHVGEIDGLHTYAFDYDRLSRQTDARRFDGSAELPANTERDIHYDAGGNILSLERYSGVGGMPPIEQEYSYDGNRLTELRRDGEQYAFTYDESGNVVEAGNQGLTFVYNALNLPKAASDAISGTLLANFVYLCDGTKLWSYDVGNQTYYDYLGDNVYTTDSLWVTRLESMAFTGGRWVPTTGTRPQLQARHYVRDHLGSTRAIVSEGRVLERRDYYPFGKAWENPNTVVTDNRYLFNGKESQAHVGVNYLDYGARHYDPELGRWSAPDPLAEKYANVTPYAFSGNNPIRYVDLNGMSYDEWDMDREGNVVNHISTKEHDAFFIVNQVNGVWERTGEELVFDYGTVTDYRTPSYNGNELTLFDVKGDDNATKLFEFLANPGVTTNVEWTHAKTGTESSQRNIVGTSHSQPSTGVGNYLFNRKYTLREVNHNHPNGNPLPSGLESYDKTGVKTADLQAAGYYMRNNPEVKLNIYTQPFGYSPFTDRGTTDERIYIENGKYTINPY